MFSPTSCLDKNISVFISYLSSTHLNILCCPCLLFFFFFLSFSLSVSVSLLSFDTPKANAPTLVHILRFRLANYVHYACRESKRKQKTMKDRQRHFIMTLRRTMIILVAIDCSSKSTLNCSTMILTEEKRKRNV